jgi:molybdopterin biosynthesis enzyme MoaB
VIRAAVLTISDSAFAGLRADASGPAVKDRLERWGWEIAVAEVLPD